MPGPSKKIGGSASRVKYIRSHYIDRDLFKQHFEAYINILVLIEENRVNKRNAVFSTNKFMT